MAWYVKCGAQSTTMLDLGEGMQIFFSLKKLMQHAVIQWGLTVDLLSPKGYPGGPLIKLFNKSDADPKLYS